MFPAVLEVRLWMPGTASENSHSYLFQCSDATEFGSTEHTVRLEPTGHCDDFPTYWQTAAVLEPVIAESLLEIGLLAQDGCIKIPFNYLIIWDTVALAELKIYVEHISIRYSFPAQVCSFWHHVCRKFPVVYPIVQCSHIFQIDRTNSMEAANSIR